MNSKQLITHKNTLSTKGILKGFVKFLQESFTVQNNTPRSDQSLFVLAFTCCTHIVYVQVANFFFNLFFTRNLLEYAPMAFQIIHNEFTDSPALL